MSNMLDSSLMHNCLVMKWATQEHIWSSLCLATRATLETLDIWSAIIHQASGVLDSAWPQAFTTCCLVISPYTDTLWKPLWELLYWNNNFSQCCHGFDNLLLTTACSQYLWLKESLIFVEEQRTRILIVSLDSTVEAKHACVGQPMEAPNEWVYTILRVFYSADNLLNVHLNLST